MVCSSLQPSEQIQEFLSSMRERMGEEEEEDTVSIGNRSRLALPGPSMNLHTGGDEPQPQPSVRRRHYSAVLAPLQGRPGTPSPLSGSRSAPARGSILASMDYAKGTPDAPSSATCLVLAKSRLCDTLDLEPRSHRHGRGRDLQLFKSLNPHPPCPASLRASSRQTMPALFAGL